MVKALSAGGDTQYYGTVRSGPGGDPLDPTQGNPATPVGYPPDDGPGGQHLKVPSIATTDTEPDTKAAEAPPTKTSVYPSGVVTVSAVS